MSGGSVSTSIVEVVTGSGGVVHAVTQMRNGMKYFTAWKFELMSAVVVEARNEMISNDRIGGAENVGD